MDFLKKHYEKVILLVLLVAFIGLLTSLLSVIGTNKQEVNEDELRLPIFSANYKKANPSDRMFDFERLFGQGSLWTASISRTGNENFTDMLMVYPAAICGWCGKVVALSYFDEKPCPLCKTVLPRRATEIANIDAAPIGLDSDGDGIPDSEELKGGLDPNNPADALLDNDHDGFSNLYEFRHQTDMNDPLSHPPLYELIYVAGLNREKIDIRMKSISTRDDDQSNWYAEIAVAGGRPQYKYIGDTVIINEVPYKLEKIEKNEELVDKGGTVQVAENKSVVYLVGPKETLQLQVDADVYAPHQKSVIRTLGSDAELYVGLDEEFAVGDERVGEAKYTLKFIDSNATDIVIVDPASQQEVKISSEPIVPPEMRPPTAVSTSAGAAGGVNDAISPLPGGGVKASDIAF